MPIVSSRARYIFKHFYSEKARRRFDELVQFSTKFLQGLPFKCSVYRQVDRVKMSALVESYFLDVIRFKEYHFNPKNGSGSDILSHQWLASVHQEKNINPAKVAAFTAKWLLSYKPIIIIPENDDDLGNEDRELINSAAAQLALIFSLSLISISVDVVGKRLSDRLMYHFRFRPYDERSFFIIFESLLERSVYGPNVFAAPNKNESTNISNNEEAAMKRRYTKNSYSVFLAGAADCDRLRDAATEVVDDINAAIKGATKKLNMFDWRKHKLSGHMNDEFQNNVFSDAEKHWNSAHCDVMILQLWCRFGSNTAIEYDYYIESVRKQGLVMPKLLCCHFAMPASPLDLKEANIKGLLDWIDNNNKDWAEISPERGTIVTYDQYKRFLRLRLDEFLDEDHI